jgi:hypothetical protein
VTGLRRHGRTTGEDATGLHRRAVRELQRAGIPTSLSGARPARPERPRLSISTATRFAPSAWPTIPRLCYRSTRDLGVDEASKARDLNCVLTAASNAIGSPPVSELAIIRFTARGSHRSASVAAPRACRLARHGCRRGVVVQGALGAALRRFALKLRLLCRNHRDLCCATLGGAWSARGRLHRYGHLLPDCHRCLLVRSH